ncbi:exopolysaccharide biosynthesis protein [Saliniramus sp.]|uniref:exopolysaccharide biosynthesis protein n=1 Tax=Saliniramus sp. TaxID=2986772 RepID=UPI002C89ED27|nr:exopolysaccharide biosynthesis protein [Saliniramus sp.]HMB10583.1 exopolysaccharide biosynthesis protein [Saliniramus sp.]
MLRTSDILVRLAASTTGDRITLFEIVARIRARAFGVLLILFAAPNALPMPPGFSTFSAIFILLVAIQLMFGRTALWIPRRLGYKSVSRQQLDRVIAWIVPKLIRIERWSKPRYIRLTRQNARRPLGILIIILALIMALPIPIIGNMPPAIAITLMGFGMLERDGVWVGAGVVVALIDIAVIIALAFGFATIGMAIYDGMPLPF